MIGEKYFENRLSDIYSLSLIKYLNGVGTLEFGGNSIPIEWEFNFSIKGDLLLILSIDNPFFRQDNSNNIILKGTSEDGKWNLKIDNLNFGATQRNLGESNNTVIFASLRNSSLIIKRIGKKDLFDKVKGFLTNFDFHGIEFSRFQEKKFRNNFLVNIENRDILFKHIHFEDYNQVKELIENNRIDKAILSSVTIPVLDNENNKDIKNILDNLSSILSLININFNFCNLKKYYFQGEIVKLEISNNISIGIHQNVIIDNYTIKNGLKNFIENNYDNLVDLKTRIELDKFISIFSEMYEGNFIIEKKLAMLIMAYEYLLSKYLVWKGELTSGDELSIQDKLSRLNNNYLRFIPSKFLGDDLRGEVRNKLFHIGHIPQMEFDEKWKTFENYFDLLIRIVLKMLDYTDKYISRHDFKSRDVI